VKVTSNEAPRFAVFSSLQPLPPPYGLILFNTLLKE